MKFNAHLEKQVFLFSESALLFEQRGVSLNIYNLGTKSATKMLHITLESLVPDLSNAISKIFMALFVPKL